MLAQASFGRLTKISETLFMVAEDYTIIFNSTRQSAQFTARE